ncbi:MAG: hypothetical protein R3Y21_02725 [Mycoplasmatota bacterium]
MKFTDKVKDALKKDKVYENKSVTVVETDAPKKSFYEANKTGLMIGGLAFIVIIIIIMIVSLLDNECKILENLVMEQSLLYAEDNEILPYIPGDSVTIELSDLLDSKYIKEEDLTCKEEVCQGDVKITYVEEDYITTFNITDCDKCNTEENYSDWSKELDSIPNKQLVDVVVTYNYYTKENFNTEYTSYMSSENVSTDLSDYGNYLPIKDSKLPSVPDQAVITNIEQLTKNYYSYQDQQWKFYRDNGGSYSALSTEQPSGYATKDTSTAVDTEWSDWSIDYPTEYDYRTIKSSKAYQWYYEEDGEKIYYNSGEYCVDQPGEEYTEKSSDKVTMYRYQDTMYRWYNGEKRTYGSYRSVATSSYPIKDSEVTQYTSWSSYKEESSLTSENSSYRTEVIDVYSSYRIQYDIYSFDILDEAVTKEELESTLGMTLEEIYNDSTLGLSVTYKYIYKK